MNSPVFPCPFQVGQHVISPETTIHNPVRATQWNAEKKRWEVLVGSIFSDVNLWIPFDETDSEFREALRVPHTEQLWTPRRIGTQYCITFGTTRQPTKIITAPTLKDAVLQSAAYIKHNRNAGIGRREG